MDKNEFKKEIANEFNIKEQELDRFDIIIWDYTYEDYYGNAFLLLQDKNIRKLYEVNGSHCSCYGLEGQFDLEETTKEELEFRLKNNNRYGLQNYHNFRNDLIEFLKTIK